MFVNLYSKCPENSKQSEMNVVFDVEIFFM